MKEELVEANRFASYVSDYALLSSGELGACEMAIVAHPLPSGFFVEESTA